MYQVLGLDEVVIRLAMDLATNETYSGSASQGER